jgi:hypothetical protein
MHPNHILFSCATMVAPSLLVTVCVSYGNQRTTRREPPLPADRPLDLAYLRLVLTWMCVQADLNRCPMCQVLTAVEGSLRGYNDLKGGFEELERIMVRGQ